MWLKFGVAKLLCIYIGLTKFEENPEGSSFFCVDLTWNDPIFKSVKSMSSAQFSNCTGKNGSEDALSVCHALNHKLTSKVFNWSTAPI